MGFISVLKAIENDVLVAGAIIGEIEHLEPIINPLITFALPKVSSAAVQTTETKLDVTMADLMNIVKQVQVVGTHSGITDAQKLSAEAALAGQMLQAFGHITNKNVGNREEVVGGVNDLMAAIVRIQKGLTA